MKKKQKKYTKEHSKYVEELVRGGMYVTPATKLMCEHFGIVYDESIGRLFRKKMQKKGVTTNVKSIEDTEEFKVASERKFDSELTRFIITWAQAETEIKTELWENILAYADYHSAGIHVIAGRYKNPTSLSTSKSLKRNEENKQRFWAEDLLPYLDANRQQIHKYLTICSDIKIQPTASNPLSGLNGVTALESCIIGHPRVHLDTLPVLDNYPSKVICSTGSITVENYTDTKSGKKGEFHHEFGFIFVELDGDKFHIRQIQADDNGTFYDLIYKVSKGKVTTSEEKPLGIIFGDVHVGEDDKVAIDASFEMCKDMGIKNVVLHDIFNGHSISHHEKKDPFQLMRREVDGTNSLKRELKELKDFFKNRNYNFIVVRSNHDDFLDRWLMSEDWRKGTNRFEYLKYANILANGKAPKGIIPYVLEKKYKNIHALGINDSYRLAEFECGMHGHLGNNGSRGSISQYSNLNTKNIVGHCHTPRKKDGAMSVGTLSKLRVGFNNGMSSWGHANIVVYPNGKASHIFITGGEYTKLY